MPELDPTKRRLTWTVGRPCQRWLVVRGTFGAKTPSATALMTLNRDLILSIRVTMFEYLRLVTGTSSYVTWNRRGQRLVELTEGSYSEGDSQGWSGWKKKSPCPWDTPKSFFNKKSTVKERKKMVPGYSSFRCASESFVDGEGCIQRQEHSL